MYFNIFFTQKDIENKTKSSYPALVALQYRVSFLQRHCLIKGHSNIRTFGRLFSNLCEINQTCFVASALLYCSAKVHLVQRYISCKGTRVLLHSYSNKPFLIQTLCINLMYIRRLFPFNIFSHINTSSLK